MTIETTVPPAPEIDIAAALSEAQDTILDLTAQAVVLEDQRVNLAEQLAAVQAQLAGATATMSTADRLVEAYRLVDEDKLTKKAAYDAAQAEAQAAHAAELAFIRSCTPQQVSQAGIVIGPQTTHETIYARLKAVVGG